VAIRAIVVSESADSAGLAETVESLRDFNPSPVPVYALPRLPGPVEEKWRGAPPLIGLCDFDDG
jgi:hypothetical protein